MRFEDYFVKSPDTPRAITNARLGVGWLLYNYPTIHVMVYVGVAIALIQFATNGNVDVLIGLVCPTLVGICMHLLIAAIVMDDIHYGYNRRTIVMTADLYARLPRIIKEVEQQTGKKMSRREAENKLVKKRVEWSVLDLPEIDLNRRAAEIKRVLRLSLKV